MQAIQYLGANLETSCLAYGCMNLGGEWDSSPLTNDVLQRAEKAVLTALDEGITLFDHADIYCLGKSEQVFGEILSRHPELRQQIILQTKCGIRLEDSPSAGDPGRYDSSYQHIVDSVEGSLRRLQCETLDILLLHRPDPLLQPKEVARAFAELHAAGKVLNFGVSNHSWQQVERLQSALDCKLIVNQLQLSLLHSDLIWNGVVFNESGSSGDTLDVGLSRGIQIQAWAPLAQGTLLLASAPAADAESQVARLIDHLSREKGVAPEAIPLAWLLRHPACIQPIIGTTTPNRIQACCEASGVDLTRSEWTSLLVAARGEELP